MVGSKTGVRQSVSPGHAQATLPKTGRAEGEPVSTAVSDEEIRKQAYELYELRGGTEGQEVEDWLTAERYLKARKNRANKVIFR